VNGKVCLRARRSQRMGRAMPYAPLR